MMLSMVIRSPDAGSENRPSPWLMGKCGRGSVSDRDPHLPSHGWAQAGLHANCMAGSKSWRPQLCRQRVACCFLETLSCRHTASVLRAIPSGASIPSFRLPFAWHLPSAHLP